MSKKYDDIWLSRLIKLYETGLVYCILIEINMYIAF